MATDLKKASVLAFERKLDPSDALFFSGNWETRADEMSWKSIGLYEKRVRGTIANRIAGKNVETEIKKPNPQLLDCAALPADADTLKVTFSLRVLGGAGQPSACNEPAYRARLAVVVGAYAQETGFEELARRYAFNLANGRFLWRNRIGAEDVEIRVSQMKTGDASKTWTFPALDIPLRAFAASGPSAKDIAELGALMAKGLRGEEHVLLRVSAFVRMGHGLEVFPSQEFIHPKPAIGDKSKTLYAVGQVAAIHSQKIGNALRTIDTWYPDAEETGPIAVEPYGSVTTQGKAYRQPKAKTDFYSLLDGWMLKDKKPDLEQQHFVMAVLIRGGVFGEA